MPGTACWWPPLVAAVGPVPYQPLSNNKSISQILFEIVSIINNYKVMLLVNDVKHFWTFASFLIWFIFSGIILPLGRFEWTLLSNFYQEYMINLVAKVLQKNLKGQEVFILSLKFAIRLMKVPWISAFFSFFSSLA